MLRWIASISLGALVLGVIPAGAEPPVPLKLSESREAIRLQQKAVEVSGSVKSQTTRPEPFGSGLVVREVVFNKVKTAGEPLEVRIVIENSIGIFIAGPTGIPEGAPLVKTRITETLPPGASKSLPLVMPSSAVFLADQKFVFKVDIENEVLEGPSGEKDNSSPPFTLTPGMAMLSPLAFSQFKVLNPGLLPGETPKIFAQVLGGPVVAWQVSYHYAGGAVFIADYHKAPALPSTPGPDQKPPFPALQGYGDYIEVPYAVWPPGTSAPVGEKAMVRLSVADAAGQIAKADTQVALLPGDFFEGTLQIDQVAYQLSAGKIAGVTLFLSYDAQRPFVLSESGHPLFGGILVSLEIINQAPWKAGPEKYIPVTSVQKAGDFSAKGGNISYPKGFFPKGAAFEERPGAYRRV